MQLDSKAANVAKMNFDSIQRKSAGDHAQPERTNFYCNDVDPDICDSKKQIKTMLSTYNLPYMAAEILAETKVNGLLDDFMSFVKNRCSRQEMTEILAKSPEMVKFHSSFRDSGSKPNDFHVDPYEV